MSNDEQIARQIQAEFDAALLKSVPVAKYLKQLLSHERTMLQSTLLRNITHHKATSVWLQAPLSSPPPSFTTVYRPMGDVEIQFLVQHNRLPDTQPYQAIIEGPRGFVYAEKYLAGKKRTDTHPTTVVEFVCPTALIEVLKKMQMKAEDGAMSMGLGNKAGGGRNMFNECFSKGESTWRIVKVKRPMKKP